MESSIMNNIVQIIQDKWHTKAPITRSEISDVEKALAVKFPPDYINLLMWSNGGEAKLGTAYFAIWPVQDVPRRNVSASIFKYMTERFIGIGTNGGDELYALDYTRSEQPTLAIVPLGDLDPESKYTIADSLSLGIEKALAGEFDDGEYNALQGGPLTAELLTIRMTNLRAAAETAWQQKDYKKFVALLDAVQNHLTTVELKKLDFAKSKQ
jgi:4-alpha-glucanotransferase